ncbi:MAG: prepilin-type N-terminal cleavage/methylation domain-containing protein [Methylotenera sp. RIFCSPLOWO2_02_FULL_45_14]|nr:MAG: prepilin-type N-terminal cleavage/methylation domain-containing protein [Methylotenera sp. RIFCSPLOWO2_02_FULL_45_14]
MKKTQTGFTLIELAIVLVIIGLLLGGVLKGQELINSAKVKNMANDFRNIQVYVYSYQDKFRALPGDDKAAVNHVGAANNGNGDGLIGGAWNASSGESFDFWQHIRLAGLATGSTVLTDDTYAPTNADGGPVGVQAASTPSIVNLKGSYVVCSGGILGKFAKELDTAMDDGNTATGVMMTAPVASVDGATAATAVTNTGETPTIDDSTKYAVCMAF